MPFNWRLKPSPSYRGLLIILHVFNVLALIVLTTSLTSLLLAILGYGGVSYFLWRHWVRYSSIKRLHLTPTSALLIEEQQETLWQLKSPSYRAPGCVILHLQQNNKIQLLPIFFDSLPADDFRQLQVWVTCQAHALKSTINKR